MTIDQQVKLARLHSIKLRQENMRLRKKLEETTEKAKKDCARVKGEA